MKTPRPVGLLLLLTIAVVIGVVAWLRPDGSPTVGPVRAPAEQQVTGSPRSSGEGAAVGARRPVVTDPVRGEPRLRVAGSRVQWQIVDSVTGAPLPDAWLWAVRGGERLRLEADAAGWVDVDDRRLSPGLGWVRAPRHVARRVALSEPPVAGRRIELLPAVEVHFEVRWAGGCPDLPRDGVELWVWPESDPVRGVDGRPLRERIVTDAAGRAVCWLAPGPHKVAARREGVLWADRIAESVLDGPVVVSLACPVGLRVRVVEAEERRGLEGVELRPDDGLEVARRWRTAADGTVTLPVASDSDTAWVARTEGYAAQRFRVSGRAARVDELEVTLSPVTGFGGRLVGFGAGVEVVAWGARRQLGRPTRWAARVEGGHRFQVDVRRDEPFVVFARDPEGRWAYAEHPGGDGAAGNDEPITLLAEPPLSIEGRAVVGDRSADAAASWVEVTVFRLVGDTGERSQVELIGLQLPLADAGAFRAAGLPAGQLALRVHSGAVRGPVERWQLDEDLRGLRLELGLVISGRVLRSDGTAARGAVVVARDASGTSKGVARTDLQGRFEIAGLTATEHLVVVRLDAETARLAAVGGGAQDLQIRLGGR